MIYFDNFSSTKFLIFKLALAIRNDSPWRSVSRRDEESEFAPLKHRSSRLIRAHVYFFTIGLSLVLGLSGCMSDDSFIARTGSIVDISATTLPERPLTQNSIEQLPNSPPSVTNANTSAETAIGMQDKRYFVSIGRVVLGNVAVNDIFSDPDIFVQVQRRDPAVLEAIQRGKDRVSVLSRQKEAAENELEPLRTKKKRSEIVPGDPLSPARLLRLAKLTRITKGICDEVFASNSCQDCAQYDEREVCQECEACKELRFLLKIKAESEKLPGPALNTQEADRMKELEQLIEKLANELQETNKTVRKLHKSITGKTHTVTTPGSVLDFGMLPILQVLPSDELWISVYDEDVGLDDLYGSIVYYIPKTPLSEKEVELSMPNVRSVILKLISP